MRYFIRDAGNWTGLACWAGRLGVLVIFDRKEAICLVMKRFSSWANRELQVSSYHFFFLFLNDLQRLVPRLFTSTLISRRKLRETNEVVTSLVHDARLRMQRALGAAGWVLSVIKCRAVKSKDEAEREPQRTESERGVPPLGYIREGRGQHGQLCNTSLQAPRVSLVFGLRSKVFRFRVLCRRPNTRS